jgi:hypothetical protein
MTRVSECIIKTLAEDGTCHVFKMVGAASMHLIEAFERAIQGYEGCLSLETAVCDRGGKPRSTHQHIQMGPHKVRAMEIMDASAHHSCFNQADLPVWLSIIFLNGEGRYPCKIVPNEKIKITNHGCLVGQTLHRNGRDTSVSVKARHAPNQNMPQQATFI